MNGIKRIEITNFQSHAKTVIEPAPPSGLTVLVGASDAGKTATLRALRWLLFNEPQGADFRRVGTSTVEVGIELADGTWVIRRRTPSQNAYVVNGSVLLGFGSSVPTEVQAATGVRVLKLGDLELKPNLTTQLEGPFLGSGVSGPTRAKALGELAGLGILDTANRELSADLHKAKIELKRLDGEIEQTEAAIARYAYLPRLAETLVRLRELTVRLNAAETRLSTLQPLHDRLATLRVQAAQARAVLARLAGLDAAAERAEAAQTGVVRLAALRTAAAKLSDIASRASAARAVMTRWAQLPVAEGAVNWAAEAIRTWGTLARLRATLARADAGMAQAYITIETTAPVVALAPRVAGAERAASSLASLRDAFAHLVRIDAAIPPIQAALVAGHRAEEAATVTDRVAGLSGRLARLQAIRARLTEMADAVLVAQERHGAAAEELEDAREAYEAALLEAGRCPTCGQAVGADALRHVGEVLAA